jgi:hypothetical protein
MDGRTQLPVINYLQERFNAQYVDVVSEPGPNGILAKQTDQSLVESIFKRVDISLQHHHSKGIAIVGHHDCAGNPVEKPEQIANVQEAIALLKSHYSEVEIIGLWVDENWNVHEI